MGDQHHEDIPDMDNQISGDIPDIKENSEWHKDILQMLIGWKNDTIASVGPPNQRAKFVWKDADEIYINAGSYFHDGTTRQTVFWDAQITFQFGSGGSNALSDDLTASAWHYVYLDDSAIVTQADPELDAGCFLNDTTAPSWSHTKHGWYNGEDRCIFAVLTDGDSYILEFHHDGDLVLFADDIGSRTAVTITATWTDVTLTAPGFSTKVETMFYQAYSYTDTDFIYVGWRTNGQTATAGHRIALTSANAGVLPVTLNTVPVITDSSQKIEVKRLSGSVDGPLTVYADGWYLPIGL